MEEKIKIARVATVPFFLDRQLRQQMADLLEKGFDVTAIASPGEEWARMESMDKLKCVSLTIARAPAPITDLVSLYKLYRLFRNEKFDIIHSTTPKAGLLCAIAAKLAGIPTRLHTFTGQTWATKQGIGRIILRFLDKLIVWLNTQCYADSRSQRDFINSEGIGTDVSVKVLGKGSLSGVDFSRFDRYEWQDKKDEIRNDLGFKDSDFVLVFVGRISRDKGIYELMEAFKALQNQHPELYLLLVGPCEEKRMEPELEQWSQIPKVQYIGMTDTPERYLSIANLLCLPSYREGFGTVVLEAAAMEVATLGSKINGLIDAVVDGETGILVESENAIALQGALEELLVNRSFCKQLGMQAYERCQQDFNSKDMSSLLAEEYQALYSIKNET